MFDETDPVVRAIEAPFEANMGEFYRRVNDANALYQDEMAKLDKEKEERERALAGEAEEPEPEKPTRPSSEFDYDSPLASERPEPRSWPGNSQSAPVRQESNEDHDDQVESPPRRRLRATWTQPDPEPEPEQQPWSPPPPSPRRAPRPAARDDEDYSNESWLQ